MARFSTFPAEMRAAVQLCLGHAVGMDTDDDLILDLLESVTLDVLERIGDDSEARYQFFKRFVELARETVEASGRDPEN